MGIAKPACIELKSLRSTLHFNASHEMMEEKSPGLRGEHGVKVLFVVFSFCKKNFSKEVNYVGLYQWRNFRNKAQIS